MNKSSDTKEVVETSKEQENEIEVKSLTSICLRYFIHFVILDLLVLVLFSFLLVPVLSAILQPFLTLLKDNNLLFFLVICLINFGIYFCFYYFLTKLCLKDTFIKGRRLEKDQSQKFLIFILVVIPVLIFIQGLISGNSSEGMGYTTLEFIPSLLMAAASSLAAWVNRKRIKVSD